MYSNKINCFKFFSGKKILLSARNVKGKNFLVILFNGKASNLLSTMKIMTLKSQTSCHYWNQNVKKWMEVKKLDKYLMMKYLLMTILLTFFICFQFVMITYLYIVISLCSFSNDIYIYIYHC